MERPGHGPAGRLSMARAAGLVEVTLPALTALDAAAVQAEGDYDAVELRGLDLTGLDAPDVRFLGCGLYDCRLDDAVLARARLAECVVTGLQANRVELVSSSWRTVVVSDCRFGALLAPASTLTRVRVIGGKLDLVNLRGARLSEVRFEECRLGEVDVGAAQLRRVSFVGCQVDRLVLSGSRLEEVDVSTSELHRVDGVESLSGAVISTAQLAELAPAFAAHLGVRVGSGPP